MKSTSKGRQNKLAGQIGEYLVCAELGRRNLIATPFAGNVPAFDILATDESCRTVPIQVKASRGDRWPTDARHWLQLEYDPQTGVQQNLGLTKIQNPDLIFVCVAIAAPEVSKERKDRFFILTKAQLQEVCRRCYSDWMDRHQWKRPKTQESFDCRYSIIDLQSFEDNWRIITDRFAPTNPIQSHESKED